MMMKPSQNKNYTAADIQKYHSGKMSFEEMNEMEKAALEDPMLADAIEGYENKKNTDNNLAFLKEKINNLNSKKSATNIRKLYTSLSIAASVLAIFSIAYFVINKTEIKQPQLSTVNTSPTQNESSTQSSTPTEPTTADNNTKVDSSASLVRNENNNNNKILENNTPHVDDISGDFSAKEAAELANILKSDKQKVSKKIIEKNKIQLGDNSLASASNTSTANATTIQQSGSVTVSENNDGTYIAKLDSDSKKETSAKQNFDEQITSDSISSYAIVKNDEVKAITVARAKPTIPSAANINYNNSDLNTQEVVVTGYGSNNRKKSLSVDAQPISAKDLKYTENSGGNENNNFDNYVIAHKTICKDEAGIEIHGTVVLKFSVNKNGRPEKIKVDQSLNPACDNQAIQLLANGPDWKISKKKANVKITF